MNSRAARADDWLGRHAPPWLVLVAGAAMAPAFLLQRDLLLRGGLFVVFLCLGALSGRRPRLLAYLGTCVGIVACNLLVPVGRVLASPLGLPITGGALAVGVEKATAMGGLMALSHVAIRPGLRLPGSVGGLLATSLLYFDRIMGQGARIYRRDVTGSIDALLRDAWARPLPRRAPRAPARAGGRGARAGAMALLGAVVAGAWLLLALSRLLPGTGWGR